MVKINIALRGVGEAEQKVIFMIRKLLVALPLYKKWRLDMETLFINKLEIESKFDYKKLFSATKSTALDQKLNSLLKAGL